MTTKELLIQEIETLPPELFAEALNLIRGIKTSYTEKEFKIAQQEAVSSSDSIDSGNEEQLTYRAASGRSILRHAGTWQGDDFEECLQSVYATRGKAKFDEENPFE
ncbi:DUF2281 domain-containing protein [Calothrix sp. CCY 0018]|uniref:DUF2281 domain-containing protein n=1 Tax=Calothrix sp. CCY 0018 TaxID=3103864 RepID=UPI0039C603D2